MSQKRNLSPSLTINNWDENITCSTTQSGLSQHLLDAHRMARERGANPSSSHHKLDWQSDNDSTYPPPTAELLSWSLRSWGENGRGEMMRVWENASHNCITNILTSFIPFTGNTSYNSNEDLVEGFSPACYYFIISQHLLLIWLLNTPNGFRDQTIQDLRYHSSHSDN